MQIADYLWRLHLSVTSRLLLVSLDVFGVSVLVNGVDSCLHERDMAVANIYLPPGRLIQKVGRDRDFVYLKSYYIIIYVVYIIMRTAPMRDCFFRSLSHAHNSFSGRALLNCASTGGGPV